MDYEQLPRAALVRMLQEHDAALVDAGKNELHRPNSSVANNQTGEA